MGHLQTAREGLLRWRWEIGILLVGVALAVGTAATTSPTADEAKHIINGQSFEATGGALHDETPSARLHSIFIDPTIQSADRIAAHGPASIWSQANAQDAFRISFLSRVFTVMAFLVLLVICMRWAHALFPPTPARVVLALVATSPTLLAHASVATSDMFITTCAFGACYALFRYQQEASMARAVDLGLWTGFALLAKISGVFVYATVVAAFAWLLIRQPKLGSETPRPRHLKRDAGRFALVLVVPLVILHAGYGFRGALRPMSESRLQSGMLRELAATLGELPLPVPSGLVQALDFSLADRQWRRDAKLPSYMLGESYVGSRLGYFPFAFLVKTSGIVLLFLGLGLWAARRQRPPNTILALGLFPLSFVAVNVCFNSFDIGVRYLLPIYPFVILWGGFGMLGGLGARIAVLAASAQLVIAGVEFPNYLASFNFTSWFVPKRVLLSDSNLDWGQMNHLVTADLQAHPTTAPVRVCTLGPVIGLSRPRERECGLTAGEGRIYLSETIQNFDVVTRFISVLRPAPTRTLSDVITVYDISSEADFDVTFINEWEISAPFPAPANPENTKWMQQQSAFSRVHTRFGLLDLGVLDRQPLTNTCILARSVAPFEGQLLFGADDTAILYDRGSITARDTTPSNLTWPETVVELARPTQVRLMACNLSGNFALQAAVRPRR